MDRRELRGLLVAAALLYPGAASAQAPPDLYVVIAADTDDNVVKSGIGPGCFKDLATVNGLFTNHPPDGKQVVVKVFAGARAFPNEDPKYVGPDNFTQSAIREYLESIPVGPNTGVLFYFSGHGNYTYQDGHRMVIPGPNDNWFPDEEVFNVVAARGKADPRQKVRMIAVITDACCGNEGPFERKAPDSQPPGPRARGGKRTKEVLHDLFVRPRPADEAADPVLLHVNGASEGQLAFGPPQIGGLFTYSLYRAILANGGEAGYVDDANKDGVLTWHEILPRAGRLTMEEFDVANKEEVKRSGRPLAGPDGKPQPTQAPQPFRLPDPGKDYPAAKGFRPPYSVGLDGKGQGPAGGMRVEKVVPGGPAARAGLQAGDVVRGANGRSVRNFSDFAGIVDFATAPELKLKVERNGKILDLTVVMTKN